MATGKKPKKGKRKIRGSKKAKTKGPSKVKRGKSRGTLVARRADLRGPDTEWWDAFLSKQRESGIHLPNPRLSSPQNPDCSFLLCCFIRQANRQPISSIFVCVCILCPDLGWATFFCWMDESCRYESCADCDLALQTAVLLRRILEAEDPVGGGRAATVP
jgi:hypothetical protein